MDDGFVDGWRMYVYEWIDIMIDWCMMDGWKDDGWTIYERLGDENRTDYV